jgi:phage-related protein
LAEGAIAAAYVELRSDSSGLPGEVSGALGELGDEISAKVDAAMTEVRAKVNAALAGVGSAFAEAGAVAGDAFAGVGARIGADVTEGMDEAKASMAAIPAEASAAADESGSAWSATWDRIRAGAAATAHSIRTAMGSAATSAEESTAKVSESAKASAGEAKGGFADMAKSTAAVMVPLAGIDLFKSAVSSAQNAQAQLRVTSAVIKSTGGAAGVTAGQISKLADSQSEQTGISADQIRAAENVMLSMRGVANQAGANNGIYNQSIIASENLSAVMGIGATQSARMLGRALANPALGMTALTRAGVQFTKQQQDQIKTLVASGHTLQAQQMILAAVQTRVGGAAAAAATPVQKLTATMDVMKEDVGTSILPAFNQLVGSFAGLLPVLEPVLETIGGGLVKVLEALMPAVEALVPVVSDLASFLAGALGQAVDMVVPLFTGLLHAVEPLVDLAERVLTALLSAAEPLIPPIIAIADAFASSLGPVIAEMVPVIDQFSGVLVQLVTAAAPLLKIVAQLMPVMFQFDLTLLPLIGDLLQLAGPVLVPLVQVLVEVIGALQPVLPLIIGLSDPVLGLVLAFGEVKPVLVDVVDALGSVAGYVSGVFEPMLHDLAGVFSAVWSAITTAVSTAARAVLAAVESLVSAVVTVWTSEWHAAVDVVTWAVTTVPRAISAAVGAVTAAAGAVGSAIWHGIDDAWQQVVHLFSNVGGDIANLVEGSLSALSKVGADIIHAIVQGITSAAGDIGKAIENAIPGGGVVKSALKLVGLDTGGYIPGAAGSPQLIVAHGGEYMLSRDQLSDLRIATQSVQGGPTPLSKLGFSVAGPAAAAPAPPAGNQYVFAPNLQISGVDPATIVPLVQKMISDAQDDFVAQVEQQATAAGRG